MKHVRGLMMALVLVAGAAGAEETKAAPKSWDTSIAAGVTASDGNSDIMQGTVNVLTENDCANGGAFRAGLDFSYGEISGDTTNENGKVFAGYRQPIKDRWYGLADLTVAYDNIADVDYRVTLAPGLGYYAMKSDVVTLGLEAGPAYIWEKVDGEKDDYFALRFATRYDRKLSDTSKTWFAAEYLPRADDFDDYLLNAEIGVEAQINATMALRLAFTDKYDSTPAEGRERNDSTITGSLVYKL